MRKFYLIIAGLYVAAYLVPLATRPLIIPDETRYAEIPREMIVSGDWIVPRLNGLRYFEKPDLGYWLNAISMGLLGPNRFAVRLPAALAAGLTAALLSMLISRCSEDRLWSVLSCAVLLTCVFFYGIGTFAVLDMPLTFFLTGAMVCFFLAYRAQGKERRLPEVFCGVFCGLAFLTKGFLAFAVPLVAIVPFMLWENRGRDLPRLLWRPALAALLVVLPWSIAIHVREPDFWRFFFWHEHVRRFLSDQPQHPEPFWFFLPVLLVATFPWTLVVPAAVSGLKRQRNRDRSLLRYCLCWFLLPLLFFSASRGKLATYLLPCMPPLAILVSAGSITYLRGGKQKLFNGGAYLGSGGFALAAVLLVLCVFSPVEIFPIHSRGEEYRWVLATSSLISWAAALCAAGRLRALGHKLLFFALGPAVLMMLAGTVIPDEAKEGKAPDEFLARYAGRATSRTTLVVDHRLVRAVCWFWKRDDLLVTGGDGELEYGLEQADAAGRLLTVGQLRELAGRASPGRPVILIAKARRYREWQDSLPEPAFVRVGQGFALAEYGTGSPPEAPRGGCARNKD